MWRQFIGKCKLLIFGSYVDTYLFYYHERFFFLILGFNHSWTENEEDVGI